MLRYYRKILDHEAMYVRIALVLAQLGITSRWLAEWCFYLEGGVLLSSDQVSNLSYLLGETFDPDGTRPETSWLDGMAEVLEMGPRPNFQSPASSTTVNVLGKIGLAGFVRAERSWRVGLSDQLDAERRAALAAALHDPMTEMIYVESPSSFLLSSEPEPTFRVPLQDGGLEALQDFSRQRGLGFDPEDQAWIMELFDGRDPTNVELNMLAQAMSDHSRHTIWRARLVRDGVELDYSLWDLIQRPLLRHRGNVLVGFADDASAIYGYQVPTLVRRDPTTASGIEVVDLPRHITCTAETHNHPSGVECYHGAYTGLTGMIRDAMSMGQGSSYLSAGAGYAFGRLPVPTLGWEPIDGPWHDQLHLAVRVSNGVSDAANCSGIPLTGGYVQCYGEIAPSGQHIGWEAKPIVEACATGLVDDLLLYGQKPTSSQHLVLLGGPNYRIGMGGASASSAAASTNSDEIDFASVQRGDAEMQLRVYEVIKALSEISHNRGRSVIRLIHDLGAGGNCNAIPEAAEGAGAIVYADCFAIADPTLSDEELWANESQERELIVVDEQDLPLVETVATRYNCPLQDVGHITGDGKIVLEGRDGQPAVDMVLDEFLGRKLRKIIEFDPWQADLLPLTIDWSVDLDEMVQRVLAHPNVASKRWLLSKADTSVGGRTVQEPRVGPYQLTIADCGIEAHSVLGKTGTARSFGVSGVLSLIDPKEAGRYAVAKSLMSLMGVACEATDISLQVNWMWPAKRDMDRYQLAVKALSDYCCELELDTVSGDGVAPDGGKDSNSMLRVLPDGSVVQAPGLVTVKAYAPVPDVDLRATADLKCAQDGLGHTSLVWVRFDNWAPSLGGSVLAQAYGQLGDKSPPAPPAQDVLRLKQLINPWLRDGRILALKDIGKGGLMISAIKMALGGGCSLSLQLDGLGENAEDLLLSEACGLLVELSARNSASIVVDLQEAGFWAHRIGRASVIDYPRVVVNQGSARLFEAKHNTLMEWYESTSHLLDRAQSTPDVVDHEYQSIVEQSTPTWKLTYTPNYSPPEVWLRQSKPKLGVISEEGTNSDAEAKLSWLVAGFEVVDITMNDLASGSYELDGLSGLHFSGGFAYGDVLDAGKAWAAIIRDNPRVADQFAAYRERADNFIFGPCNGAQVMALLGWLDDPGTPERDYTRFVSNQSGRFESRWSQVQIADSPAVLLRGMAGSSIGVWVAHGHGRYRPGPVAHTAVVYDRHELGYPHNPNGSYEAVAGVWGRGGQDLAMMPHPERSPYRLWQCGWLPYEYRHLPVSPWLRLFQNGYEYAAQA